MATSPQKVLDNTFSSLKNDNTQPAVAIFCMIEGGQKMKKLAINNFIHKPLIKILVRTFGI